MYIKRHLPPYGPGRRRPWIFRDSYWGMSPAEIWGVLATMAGLVSVLAYVL